MRKIVITGATRGLGLAFATQLSKDPTNHVILAVRDLKAGHAVAERLGTNVEAAHLDMASSSSIQEFVAGWAEPIFALINNAGLQVHGPARFTEDGVELTLAVNHLGVLQLTLGLMPWLKGATVMGIGSGTHNPNERLAKMFGFRGGRFSSIAALARGEVDADTERQAGLDRYATSKLLSMTSTAELGRRYSDTRFVTLDPGLMPGTGLVRTAPRIVRWAWNSAMPYLVPLVPGASTPDRSAAAGINILFSSDTATGATYDHHGALSQDLWSKVNNPNFGQEVMGQSLNYLAEKSTLPAKDLAYAS